MIRAFAFGAAIAFLLAFAHSSVAQQKIQVRFGILAPAADGTAQLVETTRVPNVVGQAYGWVATIEPASTPVVWLEELLLPAAAKTWPDARAEPSIAVNDARTTARTRGVVQPGERVFSHFWTVAPDDPSGRYTIVVKVSDGVVAELAFDVVGKQ